jgi:hypothetical protein
LPPRRSIPVVLRLGAENELHLRPRECCFNASLCDRNTFVSALSATAAFHEAVLSGFFGPCCGRLVASANGVRDRWFSSLGLSCWWTVLLLVDCSDRCLSAGLRRPRAVGYHSIYLI